MPYSFKKVTIYVFDVHPAISLLKYPSKTYFQQDFAFLGVPQEYEQAYQGNKTVKTASFTFSPLPIYEQEKSHFWKSYGSVQLKSGKPDVWGLQMPFADLRVKAGLTLDHNLPDVKISVIPSIFLCTLGWSTQLRLELKGELKKDDLIALVGWLTRGGESPFSFSSGGAKMDKKDVFRSLNGKVLTEVYQQANPPHQNTKIISQLVISLNSYEGDVTPYRKLPSADVALMRRLLFGEQVDDDELNDHEKTNPVLKAFITPNAVNFALLNFEQGALIFLQREAQSKGQTSEDRRKLICFAENCKNCLATALLLLQFYTRTGTTPVDSDLGRIKAGLPAIIKLLPDNYTSLFCTNLLTQHKGFKDMTT